MQDNNAIIIVEIKCRASCEECVIIDSDSNEPRVNYLKIENNKPVLKTSSIIYTQCQIQMYISGLDHCDLFVYSPLISYIIPVVRNEKFLEEVLLKCEEFYFQHYLPPLQIYIENATSTCSTKSAACTFTGKDVSNTMLQALNNIYFKLIS